ncbi:uncharacterized protein LOC100904139 [Galendromus occidentalis]|uniref:Uncharacterized protein LOC100904139 n=1 Tax=Galendromus occidentalis TaxID=34638 RepID=A0AAJ6QUW7_9ACAR|nr:uncharacterized protein LOC100904139 [Galendromus occidentalis]
MKSSVALLALIAGAAFGRLMNLPSGAEYLLDHMETSFSCSGRAGYFADEEHHCRVYHLCTQLGQGVQHYSFVCGNHTIFDQLSLTCRYPEDSVPCEYATYFSYVNERIGSPHNLHYEGDIERAAPYTTERYDHFLFDQKPTEEGRSDGQEYQEVEQSSGQQSDFAQESESQSDFAHRFDPQSDFADPSEPQSDYVQHFEAQSDSVQQFDSQPVGFYIGCASSQSTLQLPAGAELLLGPIRTSFQCPMAYGYYADADNDCRVFHVCNPVQRGDRLKVEKYSFICGNLTVFDQLSQTCTFPNNAIPCGNAAEFFYLNERIGVEKAFFHADEDIAAAAKLVPLFGRYADSPTQNGRPGGKPLGFKGKAFFTNRDRKPAQSVREDLNVSEIDIRPGNNRLRLPLDGASLNLRKKSRTRPVRGKKAAGRRRSSTPSFGKLPGYGNRLNLDVINFRDNDFNVKRLELMSGQRKSRQRTAQQTRHQAERKTVTNQERQTAESFGEPHIDNRYALTTKAPSNQRTSVLGDSDESDDKPPSAKGADELPKPSTASTPRKQTEAPTTTHGANIDAKAVDDTKTQPRLVREKSDTKEMPNRSSAELVTKPPSKKSQPESELKETDRVIPAKTPAPIKLSAAAKSSGQKQTPTKSTSAVKKVSKKTEGSHQGGKIKKRVPSKVGVSETAGKPNSESTAPLKPKASDTAGAPQATRKQTKILSTAAPAVSTTPSAQETSTPSSKSVQYRIEERYDIVPGSECHFNNNPRHWNGHDVSPPVDPDAIGEGVEKPGCRIVQIDGGTEISEYKLPDDRGYDTSSVGNYFKHND